MIHSWKREKFFLLLHKFTWNNVHTNRGILGHPLVWNWTLDSASQWKPERKCEYTQITYSNSRHYVPTTHVWWTVFEFSRLNVLKQRRSDGNKIQSQILYGFAIHNLHQLLLYITLPILPTPFMLKVCHGRLSWDLSMLHFGRCRWVVSLWSWQENPEDSTRLHFFNVRVIHPWNNHSQDDDSNSSLASLKTCWDPILKSVSYFYFLYVQLNRWINSLSLALQLSVH